MLSALRSPANTCILTVQDLLGLGSSARINTPSTVGAHQLELAYAPRRPNPGHFGASIYRDLRRRSGGKE